MQGSSKPVEPETLARPGYCPLCENTCDTWLPLQRDVGLAERRTEPALRLCPHCRSFERTRHLWLYIKQTNWLAGCTQFLHFAPERGLEAQLRKVLGARYGSTDLFMKTVDRNEDITGMSFPDDSFSHIYCSNVLEHVPDDAAAMRELYRILTPGGTAIIQVPVRGNVTYEDPAIVEPRERAIHFGQADHVRYYGTDIAERLAAAGFYVHPFFMLDVLDLSAGDVERMNLNKREWIHLCVKPDPAQPDSARHPQVLASQSGPPTGSAAQAAQGVYSLERAAGAFFSCSVGSIRVRGQRESTERPPGRPQGRLDAIFSELVGDIIRQERVRILELGVTRDAGVRAAKQVAPDIARYVGVDVSRPTEENAAAFEELKASFEKQGQPLYRMDSKRFFETLPEEESFDIILVQGSLSRTAMLADLRSSFPRLSERGALVVGNYDNVQHPEVTQAVTQFLDEQVKAIPEIRAVRFPFLNASVRFPVSQSILAILKS